MLKSLAAIIALLASAAASAQTYAIQAGRVIVDAAKPALGASTILVENGVITGIQGGFVAPAGAIVVDQRARTALPGLIDAHVHLTGDPGQEAQKRGEQRRIGGPGAKLLCLHSGQVKEPPSPPFVGNDGCEREQSDRLGVGWRRVGHRLSLCC